MVEIGHNVGDFELKDQKEQLFRSKDFKGKKILLSFHPLAWTPVCRDQMLSLEKNLDRFESANAIAVGVSIDSIYCKKAWAEAIGINKTRLLSDFWPHGGLALRLGLFRHKDGFSERANVIIDENGLVKFIKVYPIPEVPDIEEVLANL
ncbi:MAG TPA: redoxin domain-containing protein [Syntrophorhabdaceae bacterium]|mgnify:CR=1 FL=1|nr:redoxin domain-containing protein [Syntrophorhabdaceae bacterium]HOL05065.1 redoxin domain-containing protein [Syntrophorhabdaceae bacterium]HON85355.1 redoxin domain-containing protein [Syntrophorhabdaceae bacterium]HOT41589.1 redoxin domain-containing protein [Syntrophorhabdaceae bacterium]HPC66936.1 redoxin domain-containing protein [Syntrophorhabdaceae bacterium]